MKGILALIALMFSMVLCAQVAVPDVDLSKGILDLLLNYKALGPLGIGASAIVILVQLLKSDFFGNIFKNVNPTVKRLIVTVLGVLYGVIFQVQSGIGWGNALITGLLSAGGAVAIWEAVKPLIEKVVDSILDYILKLLEDAALRAAFLTLFGTTAVVGFKAFIAKIAVKFAFDKIVEPVIELAYRRGMLFVDKADGKIKVKRLRDASASGNESDWDTSVDEL